MRSVLGRDAFRSRALNLLVAVAALSVSVTMPAASAAEMEKGRPSDGGVTNDEDTDPCRKYEDMMRGRIEGLKKLREALEKSEKGPSGSLAGLIEGAPKVDEKLRKKVARSRSWISQLKHVGAALGCDDIDIDRELAGPPGAAVSPWRPKLESTH